MLLMQLWDAAMGRGYDGNPHLVFIDEAQLSQSNPLPRMLAEGRKFGLGLVLAHQHVGQLSDQVRDALESNSASFSAFRLSPRDAAEATLRLGESSLALGLCRLDDMRALSTLTVDGRQTEPFTLGVARKPVHCGGRSLASRIEQRSVEQLAISDPLGQALTKGRCRRSWASDRLGARIRAVGSRGPATKGPAPIKGMRADRTT